MLDEVASHDLFQGDLVRLRTIEPDDWEALRDGDLRDTDIARRSHLVTPPRSARAARQ